MDKKTVASVQGFSVRRDDPYTLSYHERDHVCRFGLEFCGPQAGCDFILYAKSALSRGWQPPFDTEEISSEQKQEILERVLSAVEFMGQKALVV